MERNNCQGNFEDENNGYVVCELKIRGSARERVVVRGGKALLHPPWSTDRYLKTT
jgi:hypothetical protein